MEVDVGRRQQHGTGQVLRDSFARLCRGLQAEEEGEEGVAGEA